MTEQDVFHLSEVEFSFDHDFDLGFYQLYTTFYYTVIDILPKNM